MTADHVTPVVCDKYYYAQEEIGLKINNIFRCVFCSDTDVVKSCFTIRKSL